MQREKAFLDHFHAPYISLLPFEEENRVSPSSNESNAGPTDLPSQDFYKNNTASVPNNPSTSALKVAEIKALKAIEKHTMLFAGQEKNKEIFEAYLLLAKSKIYQQQYLEALDALNTMQKIFSSDKRLEGVKIYQGYVYGKLKDYYRADEIFRSLKNKKLKKTEKKLASIYYSEMLLRSGKKEEAIEELANAYQLNKEKKLRSRIAFLTGQIFAHLGENQKAWASFKKAYQLARNFELEVKSQIEMAKNWSSETIPYEAAKKKLEKGAQKGTYASRKNELYYALGMLALHEGKKEEATAFFKKSIREKISDPQVRGLAFYEIGKQYFAENDYLSAGAYYDSAFTVMNYAPVKENLKALSKNIKNFSNHYYLIKKNDSILALTSMTSAEKISFFTKHIEKIKIKEAQEDLDRKKAEKEKNNAFFATSSSFSGTPSSSSFMDFASTKGFYFNSTNTIAKGSSSFKQIWGNRALTDNWRTSTKMNSLEDLRKEVLGEVKTANPRRLEPEYYIEKIPTQKEEILALKKARDTASLGLGRMYESLFSNTKLATKTLFDLVNSKPDEETELLALYQIFSMNFEKNLEASSLAKTMILDKFPYSSYAAFVKNPKREKLSQANLEVEKVYQEAYLLYGDEKFKEALDAIEIALKSFPKDYLVPKFLLLQAVITGKLGNKEKMVHLLETLVLSFEKTPEGEKAKLLLQGIKLISPPSSVPPNSLNVEPVKQDRLPTSLQKNPLSPSKEDPSLAPKPKPKEVK